MDGEEIKPKSEYHVQNKLHMVVKLNLNINNRKEH